jgi:hypothetical protein
MNQLLEQPILTVAFVIAVVAFFKKQLNLSGWKVLLAAFVVCLVIGLVPVIIVTFPLSAPWVTAVVGIVVLFLTATGSVDFITEIRNK